LSYSLNNQLGFMVVGIGIGSELAINGTAAHAFCHIIYKGLLFMTTGAVLMRTGTAKANELGGLYKTMPFTAACCIVGSMSISAFPLFSGFVSKSMILAAAAEEHHLVAWLVLLFASAGVLDHSGIKVPFFAFFAHDSGKRPDESPVSMRLAMGIAAFLCIAIGVWPQPLYHLLPYPVHFTAYDIGHVVGQMQLLLFSIVAFGWLFRSGRYPAEIYSTNLDFDWVYRVGLKRPLLWAVARAGDLRDQLKASGGRALAVTNRELIQPSFGNGPLARTQPVSTGMGLILLVLAAVLLLVYTRGSAG